jgi:pimeloyl-ACP methyl ester carboxylesterase
VRVQRHPPDRIPTDLAASGEFPAFYRKERLHPETADGWTLCITRYSPDLVPGPPSLKGKGPSISPIRGEPILLVHGFSQNRHAWTSGDFVTHLLSYGLDVFILELRGHGLSSRDLQRRMQREKGKPLPADFDYGWDIDSHFLFDVPAAVAEVKRASRRDRIFYMGHSMGGMLGYGFAGLHDDLAGLIAVAAPSDLGRGFLAVRLLARAEPVLTAMDAGLAAVSATRRVTRIGAQAVAAITGRPFEAPKPLALRYLPTDAILRWAGRQLAQHPRFYEGVGDRLPFLGNLRRVSSDDVQWLLREGGEREPRGVVHQFARWIRNDELVCYRTGFDFKSAFPRIRLPLAILYGDLDRLASAKSTESIYYRSRSSYRVWKPVTGNSHVELTMGRDAHTIAEDVRNLVAFATKTP